MYIVESLNDSVCEYDLSVAWNIASASYLQSFSVAAQDTAPRSVFFKPDGLKMYIVGSTNGNVYEYDLSVAWDISTASYLQSFSVAAQDTASIGLFFKPDGLKMYVVGLLNDSVYEYTLSVAWDITTASYLRSFSVTAQDPLPRQMFFRPNGTIMYITGLVNKSVFQYSLSVAWDITTAVYTQSVVVSETSGVGFKPNGLVMYVVGSSNDAVFSYDFV